MVFNQETCPTKDYLNKVLDAKAGLVNLTRFYTDYKQNELLIPDAIPNAVQIKSIANGNTKISYEKMRRLISRQDQLDQYFKLLVRGLIDDIGYKDFDNDTIEFLARSKQSSEFEIEYQATTSLQKKIQELDLIDKMGG